MTTDDKTLTEQVARALSEVQGYGPADMHIDWVMRYYGDFAAAVLPIVAVEVRKAQAEGWDEAAEAREFAALWKETAREHIGRADTYKEWMHEAMDALQIEQDRAEKAEYERHTYRAKMDD